MKQYSILPFIYFLLIVALGAWAYRYDQAHAQVPSFYPCAQNDWGCVNGKIQALESRVTILDQEVRMAQEASRRAATVNKDQMWSIASDNWYFNEKRTGQVK